MSTELMMPQELHVLICPVCGWCVQTEAAIQGSCAGSPWPWAPPFTHGHEDPRSHPFRHAATAMRPYIGRPA